MAIHVNILSFIIFILFLISANARPLHKEQNLHFSHFFSSANIKVKAISHAADSYTTNYTDVLGLDLLVTLFPLLQEDTDDPCVAPVWSWIECNSDATPRVIALDLTSRLLVGQLPDFSSMDALQIIDLSDNALYGLIPSFLGTFPDLQELNLANNLFYGMVPDSLACNKNLKLTLTGNSGLTESAKCSTNSPTTLGDSFSGESDGDVYSVPSRPRTKKKSKLGAILGGTISAFVVFWAGIGAFAIRRHKSRTAAAVAQASADMKGPTEPTANIPMEEMPMNAHATTNMSP